METLVQEDDRVGRAQAGASCAAPCTSASLRVARMAQLEDLFRMDPDLLEDYLDQEQAHRDYEEAMVYTREEALNEGRTEERLATARRLKAMGLSDEQIAQGVGLSLSEIGAL